MGAPNPPEAREAALAPAAQENKDAAGPLDERTASAQRSPESIGEVPDRQVTLHRLRVRTGPSEADGVKAAPEAGRAARQPDVQGRTVQVKPGETLLGILTHAYGIHAETMLPSVLAQNPEVGDPNLIEVGQIIRLPDVHRPRGGAAGDGSGSRQRE
jgi:nucleoid-associated protein YgaU